MMECIQQFHLMMLNNFSQRGFFWRCLLLKSDGICFLLWHSVFLDNSTNMPWKKLKEANMGRSNSNESWGMGLATGSLPGGILENANLHCGDLEGKGFENRPPFPLQISLSRHIKEFKLIKKPKWAARLSRTSPTLSSESFLMHSTCLFKEQSWQDVVTAKEACF